MSPFFLALTLTDVLLLWLLVRLPVRTHWAAKIAAIVVVLAFNFLSWQAVDSGTGWPVRAGLPEHAAFVACSIIEPDIATQTAGVIYVWEIPLAFSHGVLSFNPSTSEPRAYRESYDRSLHEACVTAAKAAGQGVPTGIKQSHGHAPSGGQNIPGKFHAYVLPSVKLPAKGAGQ